MTKIIKINKKINKGGKVNFELFGPTMQSKDFGDKYTLQGKFVKKKIVNSV